ncbi:hypothetical protein FGO68_gene2492 [Halteria grandinella]|uniref:Uncharacterized protein n=1 Tax=Halteria grandinella TaxID=5974 RepID=A0A8J8NUC4_HALGN|nr:hypothetical protein FGO68_gene2492 [Halteria grandinella]
MTQMREIYQNKISILYIYEALKIPCMKKISQCVTTKLLKQFKLIRYIILQPTTNNYMTELQQPFRPNTLALPNSPHVSTEFVDLLSQFIIKKSIDYEEEIEEGKADQIKIKYNKLDQSTVNCNQEVFPNFDSRLMNIRKCQQENYRIGSNLTENSPIHKVQVMLSQIDNDQQKIKSALRGSIAHRNPHSTFSNKYVLQRNTEQLTINLCNGQGLSGDTIQCETLKKSGGKMSYDLQYLQSTIIKRNPDNPYARRSCVQFTENISKIFSAFSKRDVYQPRSISYNSSLHSHNSQGMFYSPKLEQSHSQTILDQNHQSSVGSPLSKSQQRPDNSSLFQNYIGKVKSCDKYKEHRQHSSSNREQQDDLLSSKNSQRADCISSWEQQVPLISIDNNNSHKKLGENQQTRDNPTPWCSPQGCDQYYLSFCANKQNGKLNESNAVSEMAYDQANARDLNIADTGVVSCNTKYLDKAPQMKILSSHYDQKDKESICDNVQSVLECASRLAKKYKEAKNEELLSLAAIDIPDEMESSHSCDEELATKNHLQKSTALLKDGRTMFGDYASYKNRSKQF